MTNRRQHGNRRQKTVGAAHRNRVRHPANRRMAGEVLIRTDDGKHFFVPVSKLGPVRRVKKRRVVFDELTRQEFRGAVGAVDTGGETLFNVLVLYFEDHESRPPQDRPDDSTGWSPWAVGETRKVIDEIVLTIMEKLQ
jgi:hypothetical protein